MFPLAMAEANRPLRKRFSIRKEPKNPSIAASGATSLTGSLARSFSLRTVLSLGKNTAKRISKTATEPTAKPTPTVQTKVQSKVRQEDLPTFPSLSDVAT